MCAAASPLRTYLFFISGPVSNQAYALKRYTCLQRLSKLLSRPQFPSSLTFFAKGGI